MAAFGSLLHGVKIDLGFIYVSASAVRVIIASDRQNMTGIFTCCGLPGLVATFFSERQGALAATASIWVGFFSAVATWIALAQRFSGEISIASVGGIDPCMYGSIAGIGGAAVTTIIISLFHNARYDWATLKAVRVVDADGNEKDVSAHDADYDAKKLKKAAWTARGITLALFLSLFIIWPLTMYGTKYHFSKAFFRGWVIVSLLWAFFAIFTVSVFPVIEGRRTIVAIWHTFFSRKASKNLDEVLETSGGSPSNSSVSEDQDNKA